MPPSIRRALAPLAPKFISILQSWRRGSTLFDFSFHYSSTYFFNLCFHLQQYGKDVRKWLSLLRCLHKTLEGHHVSSLFHFWPFPFMRLRTASDSVEEYPKQSKICGLLDILTERCIKVVEDGKLVSHFSLLFDEIWKENCQPVILFFSNIIFRSTSTSASCRMKFQPIGASSVLFMRKLRLGAVSNSTSPVPYF